MSQPTFQPNDVSKREVKAMTKSKSYKPNVFYGSQNLLDLLDKGKDLAKIFSGKCMSSNSLSNCKGKNSIRFNCTNGHNFYLSEDKVKRIDVEAIQTNWKRARRDLKNYQLSKLRNQSRELPMNSINFMEESWCSKCFDYYTQTARIASQNGLKAIGGLYGSHILMICNKSHHMFSISYNRKLTA